MNVFLHVCVHVGMHASIFYFHLLATYSQRVQRLLEFEIVHRRAEFCLWLIHLNELGLLACPLSKLLNRCCQKMLLACVAPGFEGACVHCSVHFTISSSLL